jgi:MFS family permease
LESSKTLKKIPAILNRSFTSLQYPNYRLWFFGQMISLFGTWMQSSAQGFLVYELTESKAYLGYVGFAAGIPSLLGMNLYGGVIADRLPRRRLLVIAQTAMMILAFILAGLVFAEVVQAWHIILLAFLLGIANGIDAPARLSFVVEMVDRKEVTNAVALNATMFNIGTLFGPMIGSLTYAAFGPGWCFTINGISYLAVIAALLLMHLEPQPRNSRQTSVRQEIVNGFQYTRSDTVTRVLVINMAIVSLFGISLLNLLPAWSVEILGGDVRTNGYLMASRGFGALTAAMMLAVLSHYPVRGKLWTIGSLVMPFSLFLFSQSNLMIASMLTLAITGWCFITQANTSNAILQNRIPDELRGRVMGIYSWVFFGSMPLGSILTGQSAEAIGLPFTVIAGAIICLFSGLIVFLRLPAIRRLH